MPLLSFRVSSHVQGPQERLPWPRCQGRRKWQTVIVMVGCRIENGDSKPRVRALEVERAVQRLVTSQTLMTCLVVASMFVNVGTVLSVSALPLGSTMSFVAGGACALVAMVNFLKLKQAEKKEAQLLGAA